jgi:hypothetical protein
MVSQLVVVESAFVAELTCRGQALKPAVWEPLENVPPQGAPVWFPSSFQVACCCMKTEQDSSEEQQPDTHKASSS